METGCYEIQIGKSAEEIILSEEVTVKGEKAIPKHYTLNSTLGEIMADPKGQQIIGQMFEYTEQEMETATAGMEEGGGFINQEMMKAMMEGMPLRQMMSFIPGIEKERLKVLVEALNT